MPGATAQTTESEQLRNWLNLYWLRPENGLLMAWKSKAFEDFTFTEPALELSCGDGMFMFMHLGGAFTPDFDYFRSTSAREFRHDAFVDIYDAYQEGYRPEIETRPEFKFDVGTDWKQALLDKAEHLDLYKELVCHDNNVTPLPFEDEQFASLYSNSIYWTPNSDDLAKEMLRVLAPGGKAVLEVLTPYMLEPLDEMDSFMSPDAVEILDRQRRATMMPGAHDYAEWSEIFQRAGFKIDDARSVYPNKKLIDIWNVGLRPISHLLIEMAEQIPAEERARIKEEWVSILHTISLPLLDLEKTYPLERAPYLMFILSK